MLEAIVLLFIMFIVFGLIFKRTKKFTFQELVDEEIGVQKAKSKRELDEENLRQVNALRRRKLSEMTRKDIERNRLIKKYDMPDMSDAQIVMFLEMEKIERAVELSKAKAEAKSVMLRNALARGRVDPMLLKDVRLK